MGWEVTSAVTLIFLALIFLPRYLKRGIAPSPIFWRNVMIKRRVLSSTSASSLPPASAFCRLFSTPARWRSTACFRRGGIATDFSRCGYLATGNFAWSGGNFVCGDRRTARNGSGGLHQRYWAGYRRVDGAGIWPDSDGQGAALCRALSKLPPFTPRIKLSRWPDRSLADWRGIYRFNSGEHLFTGVQIGALCNARWRQKLGGRGKRGRC